MIVGITGYAQAGKDTVGGYLHRHYDFHPEAFADGLRSLMKEVNPYVLWGSTWITWNEALGLIGYGRAKKETNGRQLMVNMGDGARRVFGDDVWIRQATDLLIVDSNYVFTDVRYPNEANRIRDLGGEVWRVTRPGNGPALDERGEPFVSEVAMDRYAADFDLVNDGSMWDLECKVDALMEPMPREGITVVASGEARALIGARFGVGE